jgi:pimeloyl-ACP methyl ester carboxylesterase
MTGAVRGDPIVLIHAFQMDHREWDEVTALLQSSRQVIRYDLRGHGRSALARDPFSASFELGELMLELGVIRADVVGLSAGSNVALELALEQPELVRRLIMISPGLPDIRVNTDRAWMRPIAEAVRAGNPARAADLWWQSPIMRGTRARGVEGVRYQQVVRDNARIWTQNPAAQRPLVPSAAQRLNTLRAPLLIIVGADDETGSLPQSDSILARQPKARRVIVPRAGHMISTERPAELAKEITRFLR